MIEAMRAQTEANAITPEYLGNILQMIVNFVKSLLLVPEEDVINVTSMVQDALSTANAAVATANNALSTARGMLLNLLQAACGTDAVALSVGHWPTGGHDANLEPDCSKRECCRRDERRTSSVVGSSCAGHHSE